MRRSETGNCKTYSKSNVCYLIFSTLLVVLIASCTVSNPEQNNKEQDNEEQELSEANKTIIVANSNMSIEDMPKQSIDGIRGLSRENFTDTGTGTDTDADRVANTEKKRKGQVPPQKKISWKPSYQVENNAIIKIGDSEEIKPEGLDISIRIDGFRARVVIDGFYTNPHDQNLEGAFKFRLPNDAVPYFFAFGETATQVKNNFSAPARLKKSAEMVQFLSPESIMQQRSPHWLAPKEAIMVSKEKAAFAYNQTVARQVDPALLEWAGSGVFSAKVFPLQANKRHRVVLGYDVDLKRNGNDFIFDFPLTKESINKRINLLINKKGSKKVILNRVIEGKMRESSLLNQNNELINKNLEGTELSGIRITLTEHSNLTLLGEDDAGKFFAKQWQIKLPEDPLISQSKAVFLLDTSLSASPEKFHLWVKLIEQILLKNENEIKEFSLLSFNIDNHWWKKRFVKNSKKQRNKLTNYLNQLILEGATDFAGALNEASAPQWLVSSDKNNQLTHQKNENIYDLFVLSDGAITWGEKEAYFISEAIKKNQSDYSFLKRMYSYRLGTNGENTSLLNHLTREVGGGNYQLGLDSEIGTLAVAHKKSPWNIESVSLTGAADILIKGRPNTVYSGQLLTISGRVNSNIGNRLKLVLSKGKQTVTRQINMSERIDSNLTTRIFGQIAVNQLESIAALEGKVASSFANHFRVPGQSSSLLMLESKADYERYNIRPTEDAYVAGHKLVNEIFSQLSVGFSDLLSDPKKRLMDQITKLEKIKMINFSLPDPVAILLQEMPKDAFFIPQMVQLSQKIDRSGLSNDYLEKLFPEKIKYQPLQIEAKKRVKKYGAQDGLKVLSSLVEQMPSDVAIIRDVAFSAESWGLYQQAFNLHSLAAQLRPFEPQSYTYLAKLAHLLGKNDLALIYFEIGLASQWTNRFGDYALIHKIDYANFLRKSLQSKNSLSTKKIFYAADYAKLKLQTLNQEINLKGSDLIVAISWNTDRTDVDLHVIEPSGEECFYGHQKTQTGGFITADVTQGYGPEMYINKKAPSGNYDLLVNYYSSDRNKLGLKTKVLVRTIRHWGTDKESYKAQVISLDNQENKQKQRIAKIKI